MNPKSSHHKENFFPFLSFFLLCLYEKMDVIWTCDNNFIIYINKTMLCPLNLCSYFNYFSIKLKNFYKNVFVVRIIFSSVSHSVMSDSLQPHGLQHIRPPCPSPTPGAYSNSCPLHRWCHPTISSSLVPFSSCLQSFPASGSFPMSQFFASGGQRIGVSASASVLAMNIQDWFSLGLTGWISFQSKGLSKSSPTPQFIRINSLVLSFLFLNIYGHFKNFIFYWKILPYNVVLVSAIHQYESAISRHMSPPCLAFCPPPTTSHPSRSS